MKKILWLSIIAYIVLWSALSFWKYDQLLYNGLDLAIYNNVFWNTAHGNWFASSIHPPSYLGDHFEPLILPLSLFYRLWPDARMLLILQSIALALVAIPLYAITQFLSRRGDSEARPRTRKEWIPLLFGFAWLANPFVHNANLFEFHMLSFAPLFLFSMYYFYLQRRFFPLLVFTLLSLAVREDIALLVGAFGVLFFIEWVRGGRIGCHRRGVTREGGPPSSARNGVRTSDGGAAGQDPEEEYGDNPLAGPRATAFALTAVALSTLWLLLSFSLISHFSPEGSYKFLAYYSWIQINPISGFFAHLVKPTVLAMIVGLLIPFLFLPLTRPRFLLLALPPFLQFALTAGGGGSVVLQTHYALLFLPALFLGMIEVIASRRGDASWEWHRRGVTREGGPPSSARNGVRTSDGGAAGQDPDNKALQSLLRPLMLPLLITATLYSTLTLGPLLPALKKIFIAPPDQQLLQTKKEFLAEIPKATPLITTYEFLTPLSNRETVASLHYAFLGRKQYSEEPYHIPENITTALIDFDDFKTYQLQFAHNPFYARYYASGNDRISSFINERGLAPTKTKGSVTLFTSTGDGAQTEKILTQMHVPEARGGLELDGIRSIIRVLDPVRNPTEF